jgi:hypothetical protein
MHLYNSKGSVLYNLEKDKNNYDFGSLFIMYVNNIVRNLMLGS